MYKKDRHIFRIKSVPTRKFRALAVFASCLQCKKKLKAKTLSVCNCKLKPVCVLVYNSSLFSYQSAFSSIVGYTSTCALSAFVRRSFSLDAYRLRFLYLFLIFYDYHHIAK
jgi:hypothetical protein